MAKQLIFDLPVNAALGREDFFVSPANAAAVATIETWTLWSGGKLLLIGPKGSGKSHLAQIWAAETGAQILSAQSLASQDVSAIAETSGYVVIEDADRIAGSQSHETALFHLHNLVLAEGGRILMTAASNPSLWQLSLPDLQSRLQGTAVAALTPPDDALLAAVLVKLFADRQLNVTPRVIDYLITRMERSFDSAHELVAKLDTAALTQKKPLTQRLIASVLDKPGTGAQR